MYARLKLENGGLLEGSDVIELVGQPYEEEVPQKCALEKGAYKIRGDSAVWHVTENCTKQPFRSPEYYFSYYTSWDAVQVTTDFMLGIIPMDPLGFMPLGPLWETSYALVKHPYDPKVYVISGNTKYWIESPEVFEALYGAQAWTWIEDVHPDFLAQYTLGERIDYTDIILIIRLLRILIHRIYIK